MRAILIGASGLIGNLLAKQLIADNIFTNIKLVSRSSSGLKSDKLQEVLVDFNDDEQFRNEVRDSDVLFCCIGTTQKKVKGDKAAYRKIDFDITVNAARFCAAQLVEKFIFVSSVGADAGSKNFYLQLKGETENAVIQQNIPAVYIMRPSLLLGKRNEFRLPEWIFKGVMQATSLLLTGRLSKYRAIQAGTVARAMISAAKKDDAGNFICHYKEITALSGI